MFDHGSAIRAEGVGMEFVRRRTHRSLLTAFRHGFAGIRDPAAVKRSLDGVSLEIESGEIVGLIGSNGAGKTTLLKTIAGLYTPTDGAMSVGGNVVLLAGLGSGMIDELSVRANVWLYGAVCQIRRSTIRARFRGIIEWAELEGYEDSELRTLSAGMRTRLAFSIAMHIESEIVLLDEAFSAGDRTFNAKCDAYFSGVRGTGRTFVVATHSLDFVTKYCDRAIWMDHGRVMRFGDGQEVLDAYVEATSK